MPRVLIPLPDRDFDTTEAAIPWRYLIDAGHEVVFATEHAYVAACDPRVLEGVIFGQLGAEADARAAYRDMIATNAFQHPIRWADIVPQDYAGFLLPGGHAAGMRQYLGSADLQTMMGRCFALGRPFAAVCHGVLVLARGSRRIRALVAARLSQHVPAGLHGTPGVLADRLEAWPLLPNLSRLRGVRSACRA